LQHYCKYGFIFAAMFSRFKFNWDAVGISTSLLCAVHCALLPLIASSLPLFGINIVHNSFFEWGMISLAFLIGCYSLFHGYIKHHRSLMPVLIFATGFIFLVLKQFAESLQLAFLAIAVILIISAHFYNFKLCTQSKCSSPHHKH
jgi:tetrahydromethanopterin S-methyltransferase subunit C